jgi:hypothetical protein
VWADCYQSHEECYSMARKWLKQSKYSDCEILIEGKGELKQ